MFNAHGAGGDMEEMSLASMGNHTCITHTTTNGVTRNGSTMLVDLSGEKPKHLRNHYNRDRNKTIPILHNHNNRVQTAASNASNGNGQNGKPHIDRRVSTPTGPH